MVIAEPAEDRFAKVREALDDVSFAVVGRSALERLLANPTLASTETPEPRGAARARISGGEALRPAGRRRAAGDETAANRGAARVRRRSSWSAARTRLAQLKVELELRDSLLEVLQAKLTDL